MSIEELLSTIEAETGDEEGLSAHPSSLAGFDASRNDDTCLLGGSNVNVGNGESILHDDPTAFDAGGVTGGVPGFPSLYGIAGAPPPLPMPVGNVPGMIMADPPFGAEAKGKGGGKKRRQPGPNEMRIPVLCHNPPYRTTGCPGTLEDGIENLQGVGGDHIAFLCHKCNTRWAQVVFARDGDADPCIQDTDKLSRSERIASGAMVRSGGYTCGTCKKPKVKRGVNQADASLFCGCRCLVCKLMPNSCKCPKMLNNIASFQSADVPVPPMSISVASRAPLPPIAPQSRAMMIGGGTQLTAVQAVQAANAAVAAVRRVVPAPVPATKVVPADRSIVAAKAVPTAAPETTEASPGASVVPPPVVGASAVPSSCPEETPARKSKVPIKGTPRHTYGGKGPATLRAMAQEVDNANLSAHADELEKKLEESLTAEEAAESDAAEFDVPEPEAESAAESEVAQPEVAEQADVEPKAVEHELEKPQAPKRRKLMKPAVKTLSLQKCVGCVKINCKIRCREEGCNNYACSARCAGYYDALAMRKGGGFFCAEHSDPEDKAWHCGRCNAMITDRIEPRIDSIGCNGCETWFCLTCVGFQSNKRLPKVWMCSGCK